MRLDLSTLRAVADAVKGHMRRDLRLETAFDGVVLYVGAMPSEIVTATWRPCPRPERVIPVRVSEVAFSLERTRAFDHVLLQIDPHALGFGLE